MKSISYLLYFAILFFVSCKQKDKRIIDKERNITGLPVGDERFLALKDTAQIHMPEFIDAFQQSGGDPDLSFIIKSDFTQDEKHEHMWSIPLAYSNDRFKCVFSDSAYDLTNIKTGDTIFVKIKDIEDWAIFDNVKGIKKGSFSEKYLKGEE